jgi:hypothetical protein
MSGCSCRTTSKNDAIPNQSGIKKQKLATLFVLPQKIEVFLRGATHWQLKMKFKHSQCIPAKVEVTMRARVSNLRRSHKPNIANRIRHNMVKLPF